jgi:hypothetical protein
VGDKQHFALTSAGQEPSRLKSAQGAPTGPWLQTIS